MANMDQIESELRTYIDEADYLSRNDKFIHLKAIFDKHFAMEKTEHLLDTTDMRSMVDFAKSQYIHTTLPMVISRKEVYSSEVAHILLIESVIGHLNKFKLLRKLVKFNYNK